MSCHSLIFINDAFPQSPLGPERISITIYETLQTGFLQHDMYSLLSIVCDLTQFLFQIWLDLNLSELDKFKVILKEAEESLVCQIRDTIKTYT